MAKIHGPRPKVRQGPRSISPLDSLRDVLETRTASRPVAEDAGSLFCRWGGSARLVGGERTVCHC